MSVTQLLPEQRAEARIAGHVGGDGARLRLGRHPAEQLAHLDILLRLRRLGRRDVPRRTPFVALVAVPDA